MSTTPSTNEVILAALAATGPKPRAPRKPILGTDEVENQRLTAAYEAAQLNFAADVEDWDQAVKANARDIMVMTSGRSKIAKQLAGLAKALDPESNDGKVFTGTIVNVSREESSTRGLITLHTGTDRSTPGVPAGCEQVRTDRTDDPDGRAVARACQLLKGHRVAVYVEIEPIKGGSTKVRVLRHVEDLGIDARNPAVAA